MKRRRARCAGSCTRSWASALRRATCARSPFASHAYDDFHLIMPVFGAQPGLAFEVTL